MYGQLYVECLERKPTQRRIKPLIHTTWANSVSSGFSQTCNRKFFFHNFSLRSTTELVGFVVSIVSEYVFRAARMVSRWDCQNIVAEQKNILNDRITTIRFGNYTKKTKDRGYGRIIRIKSKLHLRLKLFIWLSRRLNRRFKNNRIFVVI